MTPLLILVLASFLARFSHQMARSPVLPRFAQDLGAAPELIGLIVAASTVTGVFIKLPAGALASAWTEEDDAAGMPLLCRDPLSLPTR